MICFKTINPKNSQEITQDCNRLVITPAFNNMQTVEFKTHQANYCYSVINDFRDPSVNKCDILVGLKGHVGKL